MKKTIWRMLFFICAAVLLLYFPIAAQAANASRTLQPGRVYTFTGQDRRVISHISVTGTGRYQFTAVDGRGNVTGYGFSSGRLSVSGDGYVQITPLAPLAVTFDSARLAVTEAPGETLRQVALANGRTLAIENKGRVNHHIRTNRAADFDIVVTNASGGLVFLDRAVRFPQFNLPAGGEAVITAEGDGLVIYFPAMLYDETIMTRRLTHPAVYTHEVWEGEIYVFTNTGERNITLAAEPFFAAAFSYDFILRDRQGFAVSHGEAADRQITVQPHRPLTITPHTDGELFFPYTLLGDLQINYGTSTPAHYTLEPGEALQITNADPSRTFDIFFTSEPGGYPIVYDFTLETGEDFIYAIQAEAGTRRIPPGGVLTVTAGFPPEWAPQTLVVRFPDVDAVTVREGQPNITEYIIEAGESVIITNAGDENLFITTKTESKELLEYVITGPEIENEIAFARLHGNTPFVALADSVTHFTNPCGEEAVSLFFPSAWLEDILTAEKTTEQALVRHVLQPGEALRFDNVNNRFNRPLLVDAEWGLLSPTAEYEYVRTDNSNAIMDYGTSNTQRADRITLRYSSRITLMPAGDEPLYVFYPALWQQRSFRTVAAAAPVLHHITLAPGERLIINNITGTTFNLSNTSAPGQAGYFTRAGRAEDFTAPIGQNANHGPIHIAPNAITTLLAARGEALHIWMPIAWARQLRLVS